ncbi:hypothetical protein jhhlp_002333 [Lomentospora prolificans]|uniref:DNA 3'-5' helicase n=1 Tax=Lomentospora prolificans TaxID=41688 RepID=A0A2N3NDS2_9PEZI|nr:hypothetical protein jhhlp_002333 [Lomentospora prolificans]
MARLLELQRPKKRTLMAKQQERHQLPTPVSTTVAGRFEQAYGHSLKAAGSSSNSSSQRSDSSLSRDGRTKSLPTPGLPLMDTDDDDDLIEITADEAGISSDSMQFGTDIRLWREDFASRPEPTTAKGKKRKSNEISNAVVSDDDDFPDLNNLMSTPAAPLPSSSRASPGTVTARYALGRAPAGPPVAKFIPTSIPRSPSPVRPKRDTKSSSPSKPAEIPDCHTRVGSLAPETKDRPSTPAGSPRKLPPVVLQPNILGPDVIKRALERTPDPRARRSSVIEDSEDEFLTPPSGSVAPLVAVAEDMQLGAIPCTFDVNMAKSVPGSSPNSMKRSKADRKGKQVARPDAVPPPSRGNSYENTLSSARSADSGSLSASLVQDPWPLQYRFNALQEKLDQNRKAFEKALRESWPRDQRDAVKLAKEKLLAQQKVICELIRKADQYQNLVHEKETLLQHISRSYRDGLTTDEDENKLDQTGDELKAMEKMFSEALADAISDDPSLLEQLNSVPSKPITAIPATEPSAFHGTRSPQKPRHPEVPSSDVVHQTQLPPQESHYHHRPPFREEPPQVHPDEFEGMFSDIEESPVQNFPTVRPVPPAIRYNTDRIPPEEMDFLSDDDPDILALADSYHLGGPSQRPPLAETSGNYQAPSRPKIPEKRLASTAAKSSFPPEQMRFPWSPEVKQMLKDRFRMETFRHNQLEAINATLAGDDAFILMPTGGGKSLCYQLPAVVKSGRTKGITVVVSPLISLMQDQVDHLKSLHIHAIAYNGESPKEYKDMVMKMFREKNPENYIELLYVTPEMVNKNKRFLDGMHRLYENGKLARIVIDEAHCVSQWGHDFRPDYKELGVVRRQFNGVPIMALTATATENVIMDVMHNLGMVNSQVFTQSFNRPNLYYEVRRKSGNASALESIADLIQTKYANQCGIVYTISRKNTEDVAKKLRGFGIKAAHYHASVPAAEKAATQREWQQDRIRVVVATIAFGMGIDKPDVRFVIHHGLPKSLEGYYQETGRAGRDGNPSDCYLYFSHADVRVLRKLISDGEGGWEQKERQKGMLNRMVAFCDNPSDCRRVEVLRYFGEMFDRADCNKRCDNCRLGAVSEQQDFTTIAQAAIEVIAREKKLTTNQCADVLMGKRKRNHDDTEGDHDDDGEGESRAPSTVRYFGIAKHLKKYEIERIIDRLTIGPNVNHFRYGHRRLMLSVQVGRGSKEPTTAKLKKRTKKDDISNLANSTDISSPVAPTSRKKKSTASSSRWDEDEGLPTRNGYQRDDFVVDSEEDDYFEPLPKKRKSNSGLSTEAPPLEDVSLGSLPDIHQEVVQNFVSVAKRLEEEIRNNTGLRRPLFSEKDFQQMAIHWTITLDEMRRIEGIDRARVNKYGEKFLKLVRDFYGEYTTMMGALGGDDSIENVLADESREIVDLISSDDDGYDDFDLDPDDNGPGEQSRFFSAPVKVPGQPTVDVSAIAQWHQRLEQASQSAPASAERSTEPVRGAPYSRGRRGGRGGWKSRGGGRRGGGGGASKRTVSGNSSTSGGRFFGRAKGPSGGKRGGRGSGGGTSGSAIGLMPL